MTALRERHKLCYDKKSDVCKYIRKKFRWLRKIINIS